MNKQNLMIIDYFFVWSGEDYEHQLDWIGYVLYNCNRPWYSGILNKDEARRTFSLSNYKIFISCFYLCDFEIWELILHYL